MQTLSYKLLPSMEEMVQYRNGALNKKRSREIELLSEENALVAEAIACATLLDTKQVETLTVSIRRTINPYLISKSFFWWKYLAWFGVVGIVGLIAFFYLNYKHDLPNNAQQTIVQNEQYVEQSFTENQTNTNIASNTLLTSKKTIPLHNEVLNSATEKQPQNNQPSNQIVSTPQKSFTKNNNTLHNVTSSNNNQNISVPDKTSKQTKAIESAASSALILNLQSVQLLQKVNPDEDKIKTSSSKQYSPLGRNNVKKSSKEYAVDDMPKFPGGDAAIIDYFRGAIRPVTVNKSSIDENNRGCYVKILVTSKGKVKESTIMGNPPESIRQQLQNALNNLPNFEGGNGVKAEYLLSIAY
jgi:hypothetical protein